MALDPAEITAKCVEVSRCLSNTEPGFHTYDLDRTRTTGDVARFAANIRMRGSLTEEQVSAVAFATKQDFRTVRADTLRHLEELGWGEIIYDGRRIARFDEDIPPIQDVLRELGKDWQSSSPTPVDSATVESLRLLSRRPYEVGALTSQLGVEESDMENALQYGQQTAYLGTFKSEEDGREIVYTPLYWAGKEEQVRRFLARQGDETLEKIGTISTTLSSSQGTPLDDLGELVPLVNAGIHKGFFPAVGVAARSKKLYSYVFSPMPHFELAPDKDVFEKARMIVACIRHGQHHAEVTPIVYPLSILSKIREGTLGYHSYGKIQYALLAVHGICRIEEGITKARTKGYRPVLIDTPENRVALDVAEEMLMGREPATASVSEPEVAELLTEGMFSYTAEQRKIKTAAKIAAPGTFDRLMESLHTGGAMR